jgi:hypothetical protein
VTDVQLLANFSSSDPRVPELAPLTLDGRWQPTEQGWAYSLSLWLWLDPSTCTSSKAAEARTTCHLFLLQDVFVLYLSSPNQLSGYFFSQKAYLEKVTRPVFIPYNQWVNVQFGANQYNGYEFKIYDVVGRLIASASESSELQPQKVTQKVVSMLKNYEGLAKSLLFYQERRALPMLKPDINITRGQFSYYGKCILYLLFAPENAIIMNWKWSLINYCV